MGIINIKLEGIETPELERVRCIIQTCFEQGLFNVRNGKVSLNFDSDGTLQEMDFSVKKWRRNKDSLKTVLLYEKADIQIN
jgi:hypothetical protein